MIALLQAKAEGLWARSQIQPNLIAGVVVGIVALPRALVELRPNVRRKRGRGGIIEQLGTSNLTDTLAEALASLNRPAAETAPCE